MPKKGNKREGSQEISSKEQEAYSDDDTLVETKGEDSGTTETAGELEETFHRPPTTSKSRTKPIAKEHALEKPSKSNFMEFWKDQKIRLPFLLLLGFAIIPHIFTILHFKHSIADLKSCSKGVPNTEGSLPCSDCMCVATDGFTSSEFSDIAWKQKLQEYRNKEFDEKIAQLEKSQEKKNQEFEKKDAQLENKLFDYENINKDDYSTELFVSKEDWKKEIQTIHERITEMETSFKTSLKDMKKDFEEKIKALQERIDQQQIEINEIKGNIQTIDGLIRRIEQRIDVTNDKIFDLDQKNKALENMKKEYEKTFSAKLKELDEMIEKYSKQMSREISEIHLYIIVFLVVMIIVIILFGPKLLGQVQAFERTVVPAQSHDQSVRLRPQQRVGGQELSHTAILEKLSSKNLEKGICIISFNSSTQMFHQKLLESINLPRMWPVKTYLINKLEDLLKVPPHTVTIVFVDFNERNIILENPETDIGDLRKSTAEIFLDLGCDVFVIYCRDKYSQSLAPPQLHSDRLNSIKQHPILAKLSKSKRVFSVYESLHPQQAAVLKGSLK